MQAFIFVIGTPFEQCASAHAAAPMLAAGNCFDLGTGKLALPFLCEFLLSIYCQFMWKYVQLAILKVEFSMKR